MRLFPLLLLSFLSVSLPAQEPSGKREISADLIIPRPVPSAPASAWQDAPGRRTIFYTVGDVTLKGFRYQGADPKLPEVLFFNGNGMTILRTDRFYRALAAAGPSVTVYDYRGYGFSSGTAHLQSFQQDGLSVYDALAKTGPVVVFGASMGTATAAFIASQRPLAGLILGMPIASAEEEFPVYARLLGFTPQMLASVTVSSEGSAIFGEKTLIHSCSAPLLVLGGADDNVVPVAQAREVFAASPAKDKKYVEIPGAGHNDVIGSELALQSVVVFLQKHGRPALSGASRAE